MVMSMSTTKTGQDEEEEENLQYDSEISGYTSR